MLKYECIDHIQNVAKRLNIYETEFFKLHILSKDL